jgi:hypothetical protein
MFPLRPFGPAIILCMICFLAVPVSADLILPAITHVYFEKDGAPYNGTVDFSVSCYGYNVVPDYRTRPPGSYQPELVFSYSASCKEYGCPVYPAYYLQYTHLDWCNLEGTTKDGRFIIRNFSSTPYTTVAFDIPGRTLRESGEYADDYLHNYYVTPEYNACKNQNYSLAHPGRNQSAEVRIFSTCNETADKECFSIFAGIGAVTEVSRNYTRFANASRDRIDQTSFIQYLETCDPVSDRECGGWILDGRPLKTYTDLFQFRNNATYLEENPCDRFLVATNESMAIPESHLSTRACLNSCSVADQILDAYFTLPNGTINATSLAEETGKPLPPRPWYGETLDLTPHPTIPAVTGTHQSPPTASLSETAAPLAIPRSPVESLYCGIVAFFGGRCE